MGKNPNKRGSKKITKFKPIYMFNDKLLKKAEAELNKPVENQVINCGPLLLAFMVILIILIFYFKTH